MKTFFSFLFLLIASPLLAQPVPKYDLGINGGVILQGTTGADRAAGGYSGISGIFRAYVDYFYPKEKEFVSLRVYNDSLKNENEISMFANITISSMVNQNWQISGSVGQYSGKSTSTFSAIVNQRLISGKDTTTIVDNPNGTMVSKLGGWIIEFGARYHFGADIHPYVGAGIRYNTQAVSETNLTVNGITSKVQMFENVDEFGGYIGAGLKIPLSKVFCIDVQADAIFRNAKIGDFDDAGDFNTAWTVEPAFRAGISFDLNSILDIGKHPSEYEDEDDPKSKTKTKPKTPKAPGPTEK